MGFLDNLFGAKLKVEIEELKSKIDNYEKNIRELQTKFETTSSKNSKLSSEVEEYKLKELSVSNEILSLKAELSKCNFLTDDLTRKNKDLKSKVDKVATVSSEAKTNELSKTYINELTQKNENLAKDLNVSKGELIYSKNKIDDLESKIDHLTTSNKELKLKVIDLENEIKAKIEKITELEKIAELEKKIYKDEVLPPPPVEVKKEEITENKEGFRGDLSDVNLFEFLQMMSLTKKEKLIMFTDLVSGKVGKIFLKGGEVIHSEFVDEEGLPAFLSIVAIKNGRFDVAKWVEPKEQTINMPSMNLFMEAARIIDEKEAVIKSLEVDIGTEAVSDSDVQNKSQNILQSIDKRKTSIGMPNKELSEIISKNLTLSGTHPIEKIRIRKILVIDDSPTIIGIMKKYLVSQGYETVTESLPRKALERLEKEDFDLIITDLDMPEVNGIEVFLWIKEHKSPDVQVILMTAFGSEEVKEFATSVGALRYFEKPLNMKNVKKVLDEINQNSAGLKGTVDDISLFDFVQMIILSRKQKRVTVIDPVTKQIGRLYISYGEIIHAECGNLSGEDAFFSIMAMKRGTFKDELWMDPAEKTITKKPMKLFMEASKRIDDEISKLNESEDNDKLLSSVTSEAVTQQSVKTEEKSLIIYEQEQSVFGMKISKTTKDEALGLLKEYPCNTNVSPKLIICDALALILLFNDQGILAEVTFGTNYKGKTSKGIATGDTIDKAVEIYGVPTLSSDKVVIWNNFAVFHQNNNTISSMRIR